VEADRIRGNIGLNGLLAILDTSFLLLVIESGRDLLRLIEERLGEPVEPVVPASVVGELNRLSAKEDRRGMAARLALKMVEKMRQLEHSSGGSVDDELMSLASHFGYIVITGDSALQKRLRRRGIKCIYVSRRLEVHILA